MKKNTLSAFTLIELIVVMAILVILSVIGFVSYTGYLRDARNTLRQTQLSQIVQAVDLYISTNGSAPRCKDAATGPTGTVCYFTDVLSTVTGDSVKRTGPADLATTSMNTTDWAKLNFKKAPEDPRNVYYVYAHNGDKYVILATQEDSGGYSTIAKGTYDYTANTTSSQANGDDEINGLLGLPYGTTTNASCVDGLPITAPNIGADDGSAACTTNPIRFVPNSSKVPYRPYQG